MCSNVSLPRQAGSSIADVAAQLAWGIDECAAAARSAGGAAEPDLAGRLAALWAMLTNADPELAKCTARYSGS
jgi:hypothetical protein